MRRPRGISLTDKAYRYLEAEVARVPLLDLPWYQDKLSGSSPDPAPGEGGPPWPPSPHGGGR